MIASISPSHISGVITAPASKSAMQRGCAAALLHEGETILGNPGTSNDDLAAIEVIKKLGADVTMVNQQLIIKKNKSKIVSGEINCGESGLGIRMFTPLAALNSNEIIINGEGSLLNRPMDFFDAIFPQLGIKIFSNRGKLPVMIKGPLQPQDITVDGSLSSQFLTGILFAFGKAAVQPVTITVTNLTSKPYIDLTLSVMKHFGYQVENDNYEKFIVHPVTIKPDPIDFIVEGDWSSASFLLVAAAIAGSVTVRGLDIFSAQADKAVLQALMSATVSLSISENEITVNASRLKAFEFDATDCPDLFPPLVALAAYSNGTTAIKGVSRLAYKESNRALTLKEEFAKMNVDILLQDDLMIIKGARAIKGAMVHSRHDHRIAMACAVAALRAEGKTVIQEAEAINKSYPKFYENLKMLGVHVTL